jgi:hypothetical protein
MNRKRRFAKLAVLLTAMISVIFVGATAASANTYSTGGTANSIWNWTTGSTTYYQSASGDDIAFNVTGGIAIDMRWISCDGAHVGSIRYDITPSEGYRTIGTNFLAGTCLHLQYRGYSRTGSFTGVTKWNVNFA